MLVHDKKRPRLLDERRVREQLSLFCYQVVAICYSTMLTVYDNEEVEKILHHLANHDQFWSQVGVQREYAGEAYKTEQQISHVKPMSHT